MTALTHIPNRAERRAAASANPPTTVEKLAYTLSEASHALSLSRSSLYRMFAAGELKALKIRGRTLVPASEIERLIGGEAA